MHFKYFILSAFTEIIFAPYLFAQNISTDIYHNKYEYVYSFKGPYITYFNRIPFWNHFHDTLPSEAQIRVVPSLKGMHGSVWTRKSFPYDEWQIEVSFRVTGKPLMGADGFAIWYTETPYEGGPVFGSADRWKGMGILFDSFDNDDKRDNPYITLFINDGTVTYEHETDGFDQVKHGCQIDYRNRPYPVKAKIIYTDQTLQLFIHNGNTLRDFYEFCANASNVHLPANYYFGISAATGGVADDHDVLKFITWSLRKKKPDEVVSESEKAKTEEQSVLQEAYQKNLDEFNAAQQRFREQHPDKVKEEQANPEDLFQGRTSSEARAVFEIQSDIQQNINALNQLIEIAAQKQDSIFRSLESNQPASIGEVARFHQAENSQVQQRRIFQDVIQLQAEMDNLKATAQIISNRMANVGTGVGSVDASKYYETLQRTATISEYIDLIEKEMKIVKEREKQYAAPISCPEIPTPSCAPMSLFVGVAVTEVVILMLYFACRQPSVDPGKKYF